MVDETRRRGSSHALPVFPASLMATYFTRRERVLGFCAMLCAEPPRGTCSKALQGLKESRSEPLSCKNGYPSLHPRGGLL